MIIVEGPDGAGKTRLVQEICERFDLEEGKHKGNKSRDDMKDLTRTRTYDALATAVHMNDKPLVYDRLYFSEIVYGPLQRNACKFDLPEQHMIEEILQALQCPIIFCLPPLDTVIGNVRKSDQMKGVLGITQDLYERYSGLYWSWHFRDLRHNVLRWDYFSEAGQTKEYIFDVIHVYLAQKESYLWR